MGGGVRTRCACIGGRHPGHTRRNSTFDTARHLDGWKEMIDDYCPELSSVQNQLYITILGLIPGELEEDITTRHDDILAFKTVVAFCKERTDGVCSKALANLKRRTGKPISAIVGGDADDDEDHPNRPATKGELDAFVAAIQSKRPQPTAAAKPTGPRGP